MPRLTPARIIFTFTALVVVYFLFAFAFNAIRGHQLGAQESRLEAEINDLESRHDRLVALEQYLKSDEYIEEVAREELGYVKQGEVGFIAISSRPTATPEPGTLPELWWDSLIR